MSLNNPFLSITNNIKQEFMPKLQANLLFTKVYKKWNTDTT